MNVKHSTYPKLLDSIHSYPNHLTMYCLQAMQAAGQIAQTIEVPAAALTLTTNIPFAGSAISRQARRLYVGK